MKFPFKPALTAATLALGLMLGCASSADATVILTFTNLQVFVGPQGGENAGTTATFVANQIANGCNDFFQFTADDLTKGTVACTTGLSTAFQCICNPGLVFFNNPVVQGAGACCPQNNFFCTAAGCAQAAGVSFSTTLNCVCFGDCLRVGISQVCVPPPVAPDTFSFLCSCTIPVTQGTLPFVAEVQTNIGRNFLLVEGNANFSPAPEVDSNTAALPVMASLFALMIAADRRRKVA